MKNDFIGKSKSAERRRSERNRGVLHIPKPGQQLTIGKVTYNVAQDGSLRKQKDDK